MIRKLLRSFLSTPLGRPLQQRFDVETYLRKRRTMKLELAKIPLTKSGYETVNGQTTPFVVLNDGTVLYGRLPSELERAVYRRWKKDISQLITEDTFQVALDVVLRYLYPHAMPHVTMPHPRDQRAGFHKQHIETIQDFPGLTPEQRQALLQKFAIRRGGKLSGCRSLHGLWNRAHGP